MRKCAALALALLALFCLSLPNQVSAQGIWVGGGVTIPTGDYGDSHDTGYTTVLGIGFPVGPEGLGIFAEGFYGKNNFSDDHHGESTSPYGVMGGVTYDLSPGEDSGIYVFGQLGLMVHKYSSDDFGDSSETGFAFGGGGGYGISLTDKLGGWVEGRYMHGMFSEEFDGMSEDYSTAFFAVLAGISVHLGEG
jgi:hypothetical protein